MSEPRWTPTDVDHARPNAARMYDYFLGGAHNFDVDREMAERLLSIAPEIRDIARHNRAFLRRAVGFLVDAGIEQFIDIGSGIPTTGNVHEVAQARNPRCRVVYVDREPVAAAHSRLLLRGNDRARVLRGDLRDPDAVLGSSPVRDLIDLTRPVAVLMISMLHFVPDGQHPAAIVADYRRRLAGGGYVALSHITANEHSDQVGRLYRQTSTPIHPRTRDEIAALLDGMRLVPPGLVLVPEWRPEPAGDATAHLSASYAAVAVV